MKMDAIGKAQVRRWKEKEKTREKSFNGINRSKRDKPVLPGDLLSIRSYHEIYELLSAGGRLSPGVEVEVTM